VKRDHSVSWRRVTAEQLDLSGLNAAIIGGTGGLGRAIALLMATRGARITVVGRTFRDAGLPGIDFVEADLTLMTEAERIARALPAEALDLLVFTTGIFAGPARQETQEGIERDLAVSYLNRVCMLRQMAPRLGTAREAPTTKRRVFVMGYPGTGQIGTPDDLNGEVSYKAFAQHMNTVAGNEILVLEAPKQYPQLNVYGLNPGLIATQIRSNYMGHNKWAFAIMEGAIRLFSQSPEAYARRIVPLMVSPDLDGVSGALFDSKGRAILPSEGMTERYRKQFLAASDALLARASVLHGGRDGKDGAQRPP